MKDTGAEPLTVGIPTASKLLGVGRSTVYKMLKAKELRFLKIGKRTVVPVAALRELVNAKSDLAQPTS